jgi:hypothetical protein
MTRALKIALLSASFLLWGVQASTLAEAVEHARGGAEPRPETRASGTRPAPRPEARPAFDGRGQRLDSRYNHGRYYPPRGSVVRSLPDGYRPYYYRGGNRYYFSGGIWYAPRGPDFIVVSPPPGLVISALPTYYSTVWIGGVPYYYADDVYYAWQPDQNSYAVVDPPANADTPSPPPDNAQGDLMIYPKNGQTQEQQAADQYDCHSWATGQTGFDPTQPGGGVPGNPDAARSNYNRAMSACLQGRGYQVN